MSSNNDEFVYGRHAGIDFLKTQDANLINKVFLQNGVINLIKKEKIHLF